MSIEPEVSTRKTRLSGGRSSVAGCRPWMPMCISSVSGFHGVSETDTVGRNGAPRSPGAGSSLAKASVLGGRGALESGDTTSGEENAETVKASTRRINLSDRAPGAGTGSAAGSGGDGAATATVPPSTGTSSNRARKVSRCLSSAAIVGSNASKRSTVSTSGSRSNAAATASEASRSPGRAPPPREVETCAISPAGAFAPPGSPASPTSAGPSVADGVAEAGSCASLRGGTAACGERPASATIGGGAALRLTLTRSAARPTAARTPAVARTGRETSALSMCRTPCSMPAQVLVRSSVRRCSAPKSWTRSKSSWARARFAFRLSASGSGVASSNARFRSSSGSVIGLFPLAIWHAAVRGPPRAASSRCLRRDRAPRRLARESSRRRS